MSYKVSNDEKIKDDKTTVFSNIIAGTVQLKYTALASDTTNGYGAGGLTNPPFVAYSKVEKFPFASATTNASNVGNLLTQARFMAASSNSPTHCYTSGGNTSFPVAVDTIDKFPISADANATDVGNLTQARSSASGSSDRVGGHGYTAGGVNWPANPVSRTDVIDKYPFSSDANATDVGNLTAPKDVSTGAGISSTTHGYVTGGVDPSGSPSSSLNVIEKFSFSVDGNATDVGDLTQARHSIARASSLNHGYSGGGYVSPSGVAKNVIDKFPFATDTYASDVGDLTEIASSRAGISSETHGHAAGGAGNTPQLDVIERYPFSTDANATDVGNLSAVTRQQAGNQG